ncbi:MAG: type II toxin-antitoxin system PemK/MazF family toxin [Janthinobacterium lividum]
MQPSEKNGLRAPSQVAADKMFTLRREKVGDVIGQINEETMIAVNRTMLVVLGLAWRPGKRPRPRQHGAALKQVAPSGDETSESMFVTAGPRIESAGCECACPSHRTPRWRSRR